MQVIDKPNQSILPFNLKKRVMTEQQHNNKLPYINLSRVRKQLKQKYHNLDQVDSKFICYHLNKHDKQKKQIIKNALKERLQIHHFEIFKPMLLSDRFLHNMSQGLTALSYRSDQYQFALKKVYDILQDFVNIPTRDILIALGEISKSYYAFFFNCVDQPQSFCCKSTIYMRISFKKNINTIFFQNQKIIENRYQFSQIITQIFCTKCNNKIIQLFGQTQDIQKKEQSPKKIKEIFKLNSQRKKINLSIMIGSGKFKKLRIDSPSNYQSSLSQRFNPQSVFSRKKNSEKGPIYIPIHHKSLNFKPDRKNKNDFNFFP